MPFFGGNSGTVVYAASLEAFGVSVPSSVPLDITAVSLLNDFTNFTDPDNILVGFSPWTGVKAGFKHIHYQFNLYSIAAAGDLLLRPDNTFNYVSAFKSVVTVDGTILAGSWSWDVINISPALPTSLPTCNVAQNTGGNISVDYSLLITCLT